MTGHQGIFIPDISISGKLVYRIIRTDAFDTLCPAPGQHRFCQNVRRLLCPSLATVPDTRNLNGLAVLYQIKLHTLQRLRCLIRKPSCILAKQKS
jgi:hypothetical protein